MARLEVSAPDLRSHLLTLELDFALLDTGSLSAMVLSILVSVITVRALLADTMSSKGAVPCRRR